ncbi:MAG: flagellar motor protein MotB [Candidatus Rokubacteria bacterium]|nr:flagellar motor protein MotB [Candidatus Rokubacteria bacterium]
MNHAAVSSASWHKQARLPRVSLAAAPEARESEARRIRPWFLAYADMITLLLTFFIVLALSGFSR